MQAEAGGGGCHQSARLLYTTSIFPAGAEAWGKEHSCRGGSSRRGGLGGGSRKTPGIAVLEDRPASDLGLTLIESGAWLGSVRPSRTITGTMGNRADVVRAWEPHADHLPGSGAARAAVRGLQAGQLPRTVLGMGSAIGAPAGCFLRGPRAWCVDGHCLPACPLGLCRCPDVSALISPKDTGWETQVGRRLSLVASL